MNRRLTEFFKIPESVRVPYFGGKWYRLMVKLDNQSILEEKLPADPLNREPREETVTVSLTSFPTRIPYVHLAIKSLMLQTYKPDRIVLWLAEDQFPTKELPAELLELQQLGLEIRYCSDNLFGHKKYFRALMEQEDNELIITYDDDIIYPPNSIERLIKAHKKFPHSIICNRAQAFLDGGDAMINPGKWKTISSEGVGKESYRLCPSTGGGCLYPKGALHPDARDPEKIKTMALRGDDLWIMFMAYQQGTSLVKTRKYHRSFTVVNRTQEEQLATGNILENAYLGMLEKLIHAYPEAWQKITADTKS